MVNCPGSDEVQLKMNCGSCHTLLGWFHWSDVCHWCQYKSIKDATQERGTLRTELLLCICHGSVTVNNTAILAVGVHTVPLNFALHFGFCYMAGLASHLLWGSAWPTTANFLLNTKLCNKLKIFSHPLMDLFPETEGVVLLWVGDKCSNELGKVSNHSSVICLWSQHRTWDFFFLSIIRHTYQSCQSKTYSNT